MLGWMSSYFYGGTTIVTVYSKTESFCGMCEATKRQLTQQGVEFEVKSLEAQDPALIEQWKAQGHLAAPIVTVPHRKDPYWDVWSGYRPDLIATLV